MAVKQLLDEAKIENYIPMRPEVRTYRGKRARIMVPAIHNIIFVHSDRERLQSVKTSVSYLQYMTRRECGKNLPIIVPDKQMEDFITVSSQPDENKIYFDLNEVKIVEWTRVRLHGGPLDGIEGKFVKLSGKRDRQVVIQVGNLVAVAVSVAKTDYLEIKSWLEFQLHHF